MKQNLTPEQLGKRRKTNKKILLFGIAILLIIGFIGSKFDKNDTAVSSANISAAPKEWKNMQYEEKEAWIKKYLKSPNDAGYQLIGEMNEAVKNKFNYPKEVDFNFGESPVFNNAQIVDAETGTVFVRGGGTAKNAFGVKSGFVYAVKLKVTQDSLYIADVSVNEAR